MYYTVKWNGDAVSMIDQRELPGRVVYRTYTNYHDVAASITDMVTRGAPAIGITAAMGIALAAKTLEVTDAADLKTQLAAVCELFAKTRPTAVNLFWAIDRMKAIIAANDSVDGIRAALEKEAVRILEDDVAMNKKIGANGAKYIADGDVVMTHCNAGALATGGYGTALGVIRAAVEAGKKIEVFACETRPYLQGARLTAWELQQDNIKVTLITDNMAGHFMRAGVIKKIVVGADRIAANGDAANKIGTYTHSVVAKAHGIPFYVAAPTSTLDPATETGDAIVIEERGIDEVAYIQGVQIAPEGIFIRNPAFDVTPAENITAIITEKGNIESPKGTGIRGLVGA
ncbi:MAG TPA: S-methyl-5-thioribose-1-phosphate isomerase [Spirochaetota bacterium]|nr:S-methyl-5-thioribose-1-phosphate isomerase [Spirochaetota bacterium]HPU89811.1 S-methyl-5-thioribose-1-phosphate isomerase [Spirochaetota bacterium]